MQTHGNAMTVTSTKTPDKQLRIIHMLQLQFCIDVQSSTLQKLSNQIKLQTHSSVSLESNCSFSQTGILYSRRDRTSPTSCTDKATHPF